MNDVVVRFPIEGEEPEGRNIKQIEAETAQNNARAAQYAREAAALRQVAAQQRGYQISTALDAARGEIERAKADYAASMDIGDFAKAAEAQEQIAAGTMRAQRLEEASYYQSSTPQAPQQSSDPVEAFAAGRAQRSADWIRQHPDHIRDPKKFAKLQAAHHDALGEGLQPDSDAYFSHIESYIGGRGEGRVRRDNRSSDVQGNSVRLTPGEAERAQDGTLVWSKYDLMAGRITNPKLVGEPIGIRAYAERKRQMMADGFYDKKLD